MGTEQTYRTLSTPAEGLYKEKGSKFIAYAVPCSSEDEAKEYLEGWRKQHHQARHVCYAYRFGFDKAKFRANDDGEPSNSAGAPILGQIQSFDLTNVLVGVVRYFGGTKLGVGGLIHAYRTAAQDALSQSEIIEREVKQVIQLEFPYSVMNEVMSALKRYGLEMNDHRFEDACWLVTEVPLTSAEAFLKDLDKIAQLEYMNKGIN